MSLKPEAIAGGAQQRERRVFLDTAPSAGSSAMDLMLCGGCKPLLVQCLAARSRADFIEVMKHYDGRCWDMKRRRKESSGNMTVTMLIPTAACVSGPNRTAA